MARPIDAREVFVQERFFDPEELLLDLTHIASATFKQKQEDQARLERIKENLTGLSDAVMHRAGQLVLPRWDYNGRNEPLAQ